MNLEIKNLQSKILRTDFRVRAFLTKAFLTASAVLCALPVAHASTCEDVFAQEAGKVTREVRETKETKAYKQAPISEQELSSFIADNLMKTPEFQSVRKVAQELGVRVWLFGGTASSFVHYAKEALLNQKGLKKLQINRFNWDFTDIFRSTQDLDIVVDGSREKINQLEEILLEKYPFFLGSKTRWEVRSLKDPSGTPGQIGYKEALLNDFNFTHQNTDSHSLAMVEVTQSKDPIVRDLKHWDSPQGEGQFLSDAIKGDITYYRNPRHFETERAKLGENPEIMSVVRVLIKAFQYDLKISQEARKQIQKIIHEFDPSTLTDAATQQFEKIVKKLVMHAVNIEYALKELDALNLREKLINIGDKNEFESSSWWINKAALESSEVGKGNGKTAEELEIDIVSHATYNFLAYESITRAHSGKPNVLISRQGFHPHEEATYVDGFYTLRGRVGHRDTGLNIRFKVNPHAREGTDFTIYRSEIIFHNKNALEVIPESLNFSAKKLFEVIKNPKKFNIDESDKALWEKFLRKVDADYMKNDLLRFFKSSNLNSSEKFKLINDFFSSSMPKNLKRSLLVFVYENELIIPKDSRLDFLSRYIEYVPPTTRAANLVLKEIKANVKIQDHDSGTFLLYASRYGHTEIVEILIKKGVNVNFKNNERNTALMYASRKGYTKIVEALLTVEGVNVNFKNNERNTALMYASRKGYTKIVEALLTIEGVDVNAKSKYYAGGTALMRAIENGHTEIVKALLEAKEINVNDKDRIGHTALIWASSHGRLEIVKILLKAEGIKVNHISKYHGTALIRASENGHIDVVKTLLEVEGINVNAKNGGGETALIMASLLGHIEIVRALLEVEGVNVNAKNNDGETALMIAYKFGHTEVEKLLRKADTNYSDLLRFFQSSKSSNLNPSKNLEMVNKLLSSSMPENSKQSLLVFVYENDSIIPKDSRLSLLSEHGKYIPPTTRAANLVLKEIKAHVKIQDQDSGALFLYASRYGYIEIIETLIKKTANAASSDNTSFIAAIRQAYNNIHKILTEPKGVNARNEDGETALMQASENGHIEIVKALLKVEEVNVNARNEDGETALMLAYKSGHTEIVKTLVKAKSIGASINKKSFDATVLMRASENGHTEIVKALLEAEGIDVNAKNSDGETALMWASRDGRTETVKILLKAEGIDVNIKSKGGASALDYAEVKEHPEIFKLLKKAGAK